MFIGKIPTEGSYWLMSSMGARTQVQKDGKRVVKVEGMKFMCEIFTVFQAVISYERENNGQNACF